MSPSEFWKKVEQLGGWVKMPGGNIRRFEYKGDYACCPIIAVYNGEGCPRHGPLSNGWFSEAGEAMGLSFEFCCDVANAADNAQGYSRPIRARLESLCAEVAP